MIPFIQTEDILRYGINWKRHYILKSFYSDRRLKLFNKIKVVLTRRSPRLRVVLDKNHFALGKVAFSVSISKISPEYLTIILNSIVIDR